MFMNSGFIVLLTALQVSARYKPVIPNYIESEINPDSTSSSNRILWGWDARPGEIPHHVSLRRVRHTGSVWRASGAIVSREWVVTVAHIFTNTQSLTVRFGVSFNNPDFILDATEWYLHSSYNNQSAAVQPNDIALVKLPRPLVYTNFVQPIRIQRSADAYRDYDGERAYISAHGQTEIHGAYSDALRWTYVRTVTNSECANSTRHAVATVICARYYNHTRQCPESEDAGAPLVHVGPDGLPTLIGLYSFRINVCGLLLPFGYTRPGPYLTWFKKVTGIDFENLQEDATTTTTSTPAPTTTTIPVTTTTSTPATTTSIATPAITSTPAPTTSTIPVTTTTSTPASTTSNIPVTTTTSTPAPTTSTIPVTTTTSTPAPTTSTIPVTTTTSTPAPTTTSKATPTITSIPAPTTTSIVTPIITSTPAPTTTTIPVTTTTSTPAPTTSTIPSTTTADLITTDFTEQQPEYTTSDDTITPDGSGEGDESDNSESDKDDDVAQLLKRLQVIVKVKVRMDKFNTTKAVGMEVDQAH